MRNSTCCFTGHRPEKLNASKEAVCLALHSEVKAAVAMGYSTFISGMSRGVDLWAALIVLKERDAGAPVKLVCAVPHAGFEQKWSREWKEIYADIISRADETVVLSDGYSQRAYFNRNRWMVDRSSLVIAVYNGAAGGTQSTMSYARKRGAKVIEIQLS